MVWGVVVGCVHVVAFGQFDHYVVSDQLIVVVLA